MLSAGNAFHTAVFILFAVVITGAVTALEVCPAADMMMDPVDLPWEADMMTLPEDHPVAVMMIHLVVRA